MLKLTREGDAVILLVKIVAGASKTRVLGEREGRSRIAVAAAAERGKANAALVAFLAKLLGVRKGDLEIVTGHRSPLKTIRIERVELEAVRAALQPGRS